MKRHAACSASLSSETLAANHVTNTASQHFDVGILHVRAMEDGASDASISAASLSISAEGVIVEDDVDVPSSQCCSL